MTLRQQFVASVTPPTPEEMQRAHDAVVTSARTHEDSLPTEIEDILDRREKVASEFAAYMREDTSEIVARMLPANEPLTLDKVMDMLHVYFWWDLNSDDPVHYLTDLLEDLDDVRFAQAVEILHNEFRDLCAEAQDLSKPVCTSESGAKCLRKSIQLYGDEYKKTMASKHQRASALTAMLMGIDFSQWHFDQEFLEEDADEMLYEETTPRPPRRPCHSLAEMMGRRAVERLIESGLDDIEAMEVNRVIGIDGELRKWGSAYDEDRAYTTFRNNGGTFEDYLQIIARERLASDIFFDLYAHQLVSDEAELEALPDDKKWAIAQATVQEDIRQFELLEAYYQLEEHGYQPFYRRQFAEDHFPREERC